MRRESGYICLAKKIYSSEIWKKPHWWTMVWIYILGKVNFEDDGELKRGEGYFTYDQIYRECNLKKEKVKNLKVLSNLFHWMKKKNQIKTEKKKLGFVVTVLNYDDYQDFKNYEILRKKDTEKDSKKDSKKDTKKTQKRHSIQYINELNELDLKSDSDSHKPSVIATKKSINIDKSSISTKPDFFLSEKIENPCLKTVIEKSDLPDVFATDGVERVLKKHCDLMNDRGWCQQVGCIQDFKSIKNKIQGITIKSPVSYFEKLLENFRSEKSDELNGRKSKIIGAAEIVNGLAEKLHYKK